MSAPALEAEFRSDEQIANDFLGYLQSESSDRVAYEVEPSRLSGGFDARLYRYKLVGQQPRVLRILRSNHEVEKLLYCQFVYKQLKQRGLKVPAIHSTCGDKSVLGGCFAVMDLISGRPLIEQSPNIHAKVLGESMAHMHELDVGPFIDAFRQAGIQEVAFLSPALEENWLDRGAKYWPWAFELVGWLRDRLPLDGEDLAVIHGDYHGGNVMFENGTVSGVLDWNFYISHPAFDVATMLNLYSIFGPHVSKKPPHYCQGFADQALKFYQGIRPLNHEHIQAFRVLNLLGPLGKASFVHEHMLRPEIRRDCLAFVEQTTGLKLSPP